MPETLIIIDLEATCSDDGSFPRDEMEIIEIGAVALPPGAATPTEEFQSFIRPQRHPVLTDFCKNLTTITQAQVDSADPFPEVLARFNQWLAPHAPHIFCSWGAYDKNQLVSDCTYHKLPYPFSEEHRNLKTEFSKALGTKKSFGVTSALYKVNLHFEGTPHRGLDDAKNIARIHLATEAKGLK